MSVNNEHEPMDELFKRLENTFDIEEPSNGHNERFLNKLQAQNANKPIPKNKFWYWKPLSIAASIVIILSVGLQLLNNPTVETSPEVEQTQFYFASLLNEEIEKLNTIATEDTKMLVNDVMQQLEKLQEDYLLLEQELKETGNTKKILYAMVVNFQTRINLLQEVISKIEETKKLKTNYTDAYENNSI